MRQSTTDGDPDAPVKAAHAALYRAGEARAYGGGLLLAGGRVLTCAHVVNQALGRPPFAQPPPVERDGAVDGLLVALPGLAPDGRYRVAVERWLPGRGGAGEEDVREGDPEWSADLALLRLVDRPAHPVPGAPLGRHRTGPSAFAWYGSGNPSTVAAVVVQGSPTAGSSWTPRTPPRAWSRGTAARRCGTAAGSGWSDWWSAAGAGGPSPSRPA